MGCCRRLGTILAFLLPAFGPVDAASQPRILYASELTRLPVGCRYIAMGDAGTALPLSAQSLFWNPASLGYRHGFEFWAEGAKLYENMSDHGALSGMIPVQDDLSTGLMYVPFYPGTFYLRDTLDASEEERWRDESLRADGSTDGRTFSNNHHLIIAGVSKLFELPRARSGSFGFPLPVDIAVGLNAKVYWQTMNIRKETRMGMNANVDLGILIRLGVDLNLVSREVSRSVFAGIAVKNAIPTDMVWFHSPDNYREPVDHSQYYGLSYVDDVGFDWLIWKAAVELHRTPDESASGDSRSIEYRNSYHYGIEAVFWHHAAIRAGLSDKTPTMGAGVMWDRYRLDYTIRFDSFAYSWVRLAVGVVF